MKYELKDYKQNVFEFIRVDSVQDYFLVETHYFGRGGFVAKNSFKLFFKTLFIEEWLNLYQRFGYLNL